ncbi:MAG: prepilin-type N-terminal cleavage/methylation domain-containing protein [Patescibacteria group bacterium]
MHKKAFTLIELMVTAAIIVVMAVVAIPAFNSYGDKNTFKLQVTEIQSLINQTNVMARNPEQGVTRYFIKVNSSDISLYKTSESSGNLIKKIAVPDTYSFTSVSSAYLVCDSPSNFCCPLTAVGACSLAPTSGTDFLTVSDTNSGGSAVIEIFSNPFKAELQ